jgi:Fe-S oxidoreductase
MMLYFRGCTAREKETSIAQATETLLDLAGVDYHILDDEKCCGSVLIRTGFLKEAEEQIAKNTEVLEGETIVTSCAGCYKTLKEDYEGLDVIHISQLLNDLTDEGRLNFSKKDLNVTYHDSCHLGRHMEVFDEPRAVIKSVAGLVEMENVRENSLCCGAGGGVKSAYPELADEMAKLRLSQAAETGCTTLVTPCPFCKLNLENDEIEVLDLSEFLIKYGDVDGDK